MPHVTKHSGEAAAGGVAPMGGNGVRLGLGCVWFWMNQTEGIMLVVGLFFGAFRLAARNGQMPQHAGSLILLVASVNVLGGWMHGISSKQSVMSPETQCQAKSSFF